MLDFLCRHDVSQEDASPRSCRTHAKKISWDRRGIPMMPHDPNPTRRSTKQGPSCTTTLLLAAKECWPNTSKKGVWLSFVWISQVKPARLMPEPLCFSVPKNLAPRVTIAFAETSSNNARQCSNITQRQVAPVQTIAQPAASDAVHSSARRGRMSQRSRQRRARRSAHDVHDQQYVCRLQH